MSEQTLNEQMSRVLLNEKRVLQELIATSNRLHSGRNLPEILDAALRGVQALGFDRVRLYLLSTDRQSLLGRAQIGMDTGFEGIQFQVASDESMQRLLADPQPQLLTRKDGTKTPFEQLLEGVEQWACVPLIFQGTVIGKVAVDNKFSRRSISETELGIVTLLASQIAFAIEHANLFAEIKRHTEQLEKLRHATLAITAQLEHGKLLETIVKEAVTLLGAKGGCIYDYLPANQTLQSIAAYGLPPTLQGHTLQVGEGMAGVLVQRGEPCMIVDDYEQWPGKAEVYAGKGNFGAVIDVLLKWRDQPIGVLCVNDDVGRTFTTEDARLLQLFADHTAIALDNAKLVTQLAEQKDRWARLIANAPSGVVAVDLRGAITDVNDKVETLLSYSRDEAIGKTIDHFYGNTREPRKIGKLLHQAPDEKLQNYVTEIYSKDGERIPIRLSATWLYDAQKNRIGSVGYFEDMRTIREAEKRLELLLKASSIVAQAKSLRAGLYDLAEMLVTFLGVSFAGIELLDEREQFLVVEAAFPTSNNTLAWNARVGERTAVQEWPGLADFLAYSEPHILTTDTAEHRALLLEITHQHQTVQAIQAMLFIPLRTEERAVGLLFLGELRIGKQAPFQQAQVELATAIANQTTVLIERIRLHEHEQRAREQLRSFYEASNALVSSQDPDIVLRDIAERARRAANATWVSVILIDEKVGQAHHLISAGFHKPFDYRPIFRPSGLSMQVIRTGVPVMINDVSQEQSRIHPSVFWEGVAAALCLSLSLRGRRIGVVWLTYDKPHHFTEAEIDGLRLYVNQAAIAYDRARRMAELEHLRRAAEAVASADGLPGMLKQIVHSACEVLQADSAVIWSYDGAEDQFVLEESVAVGISQQDWEAFRKAGPRVGGTADTVMKRGWIGVENIGAEQPEFIGKSTRELLTRIHAQSFQGVALTIEGETIGVLYVNYNQPHSFRENERKIAHTFAYHAALVLKKAKLLEQVNKARNAAHAVAEVTALEDLPQTLASIVQRTREALDCDATTLYIYNQDRENFDFPPTVAGLKYPEKVSTIGEVPINSAPYNILHLPDLYKAENAIHDPLMSGYFVEQEGIVSSVGIPLITGQRKVGVMFINHRHSHRFTTDEIANIKLFAHQAAVAIRNAQLYQGVKKQAALLEAVYGAGRAVTSSLDLNEILYRIADQAAHLTGYEEKQEGFAILTLVTGSKSKFVASYPRHALQNVHKALGEEVDLTKDADNRIGIIGRAIKTGEPQLVGDVTQNKDYLEAYQETRTELAVPIIIDNEVIGAINVEHPDANAFEQEHVRALQSLAAQAAIAIRNAHRFAELKRIKGYIGTKTAVEWIQMVSTAWGHSVRREAGTARGHIALLERLLTREEKRPAVMEELKQLTAVISDIGEIPIIAPLSYEDAVDSVPVNKLVATYLTRLWKLVPYKQIALQFDLQPTLDTVATVWVSPEWLRRVFEIVVDNAVYAMLRLNPPQKPKQLQVMTRLVDNAIAISFKDTGPGIPSQVMAKLFEKPIDKPEGSRGAGIGMMLAKTIMQTYRGDITVQATGSDGTHIMITLPVEG
jgi:PAS domain S-box-containing protein